MTYLSRELSAPSRRALATLPVLVITGLRQAGKTTFLQHDPAFEGRRYLTLDDFGTLEAARREPEALLRGGDRIVIDEVQRSPELLLALKREVDRDREPGRFVLSGSANLLLLEGVADSLAGRALYLTLPPFSRRERRQETGAVPFLVELLDTGVISERATPPRVADVEVLKGGLPPVSLVDGIDRHLWFIGYEQTYLERDLRDLSQVADLVTFRNLLRLAALRTAQVLKVSELARDAQLPASTVSRYLGLLETSFLIERIPPWLRSRTTRLIKAPKLFVSDSGIAAHLQGISQIEHGELARGGLFETWVYQNLRAILSAHALDGELCYLSVQGRYEVDFVVARGRRSVGVEVKAATRFGERDLRPLRTFLERTDGAVAGVLGYNGTETVALGDRLYAVPLSALVS